MRLVVPRSLRRLARASHAFSVRSRRRCSTTSSGAGARESCLEDDLGWGAPPTIEGEAFVRAFERALTTRGVPYAYAGGENLETSIAGATWIICVLSGGVKPALLAQLPVRRSRQEQSSRWARASPTATGDVRCARTVPRRTTPAGLSSSPCPTPRARTPLVGKCIDQLRSPHVRGRPRGRLPRRPRGPTRHREGRVRDEPDRRRGRREGRHPRRGRAGRDALPGRGRVAHSFRGSPAPCASRAPSSPASDARSVRMFSIES